MKLAILSLGLALYASAATAQEVRPNEDGYNSAGTAYGVVSTTAVGFTSTSQVSKAVSDTKAGIYRFVCSQDCNIKFGTRVTTPTATVSDSVLLPAGVPEYFVIPAMTNLGIIRNSADGTLNMTRMKK